MGKEFWRTRPLTALSCSSKQMSAVSLSAAALSPSASCLQHMGFISWYWTAIPSVHVIFFIPNIIVVIVFIVVIVSCFWRFRRSLVTVRALPPLPQRASAARPIRDFAALLCRLPWWLALLPGTTTAGAVAAAANGKASRVLSSRALNLVASCSQPPSWW